MRKRLLPFCATVLAACGPEVTARDAPPLDAPLHASSTTPATALSGGDAAGAYFAVGAAVPQAASSALEVPAILYSDLDADVAARLTGVMAGIAAELGDAVSAGQVLARLDDARETARLAAAQAALERARADHARSGGLREGGFITQAEFDGTRYEVLAAEAALRLAEVDVEHTRVTAPFAGVVTRRYTAQGRPVREGDPLYRVTALQPLRAVARLPEREARGLRPGMPAVLVDGAGVEIPAVLARLAPAVEPGSGTVEVLFNVPRPGPLLPGSSALLRLERPTAPPRQ
jgi:membrane fusion protein, multidrug efflux system